MLYAVTFLNKKYKFCFLEPVVYLFEKEYWMQFPNFFGFQKLFFIKGSKNVLYHNKNKWFQLAF